jgi:hypothetical protein
MTSVNLARRASYGKLTVEEVNDTTKEMLEEDKHYGNIVLYYASWNGEIKIVEAILDKKVNIDGLSDVSCYYYIRYT